MFMLRIRSHREDGRGHYRNARSGAAPVEGHPDGPREVHMPACEKITQPPAPFHPIPRGWAGPSLLAMIVLGSMASISPSTVSPNATPVPVPARLEQAQKRMDPPPRPILRRVGRDGRDDEDGGQGKGCRPER